MAKKARSNTAKRANPRTRDFNPAAMPGMLVECTQDGDFLTAVIRETTAIGAVIEILDEKWLSDNANSLEAGPYFFLRHCDLRILARKRAA
ncbi:MAG TPA: hypothetical protein PK402_04150 [Tepidisphaeraceae bacterium]|nr:hypothetical protein [Tepidisphaeraceae bacterium]